jgi:hypothetical protein
MSKKLIVLIVVCFVLGATVGWVSCSNYIPSTREYKQAVLEGNELYSKIKAEGSRLNKLRFEVEAERINAAAKLKEANKALKELEEKHKRN